MIYRDFDWMNPDYVSVFRQRAAALTRIREQPERVPELLAYYRDGHIADFINDWGITFDPRNVAKGRPSNIPFVLFPKQVEFVEWFVWHWQNSENGACDKSRDGGVSYLCISAVSALAVLNDGFVGGFGSRKAEYVDKNGDPKSLFWKGRQFLEALPREFNGGWSRKTDASMRITFPRTGSAITGESGDNIGRGDRTSVHVVDEAAHLEHPDDVDAALSATTLCRIDISSVKGMANSFANKTHSWDRKHVFTFHYRDDPRKDDAWVEREKRKLNNDTIWAQEYEIDYAASAEGVLIPTEWIQAAIDAHVKLGIHPVGVRMGALDVADEGADLNAFCGAHGVVVEHLEEWSGKGGDIHGTTARAFRICDRLGYRHLRYDGDGLGAGCRGAARVLNEGDGKSEGRPYDRRIVVEAYRGIAPIVDPLKKEVGDVTNEDFFQSYNAQMWWALRTRFENTYRAVVKAEKIDPDTIISIPSGVPNRQRLVTELSQPQWGSPNGRVLIEKTPEGMKSPNFADAVKIRFARMTRAVVVSKEMLNRSKRAFGNVNMKRPGTRGYGGMI